ncbi:MAG: hypothetical protein ACK5QH_14475 [Rubrivivax sp.]|jgi:hypothetical protein
MSRPLLGRGWAQPALWLWVAVVWAGGAMAQATPGGGGAAPRAASAAAPAAPAKAARVWVLRATGGRQCEAGGATLAEHRAVLQAAGVAVTAERCANDGRMRVAMCGASDGRLNALEVPAAALAQAQKLGFQAMAQLPGAQFIDCR